MRILFRHIRAIALLLCVVSAHTWAQAPDFILIQMNDVYEIAPLENGQRGGLARVATLRKQLQATCPQVFTVVSGDFLSPSLFNVLKVDGEPIKGKQMVEVLDAVGVDYVILGNHEYDHGLAVLKQRMQDSRFGWIATNVQEQTLQGPQPFERKGKPLPTEVRLKVPAGKGQGELILLGLTLDSHQRDWLALTPPRQALKTWLDKAGPQLGVAKQVPKALVALTHDYRSQDSLMAAECPQLSLIAGGHDHNRMYFRVGNVPVAKADANAKTVYVHRFYFDPNTRSYTLQSEAVAIDTSLAADPAVQVVVDRWMQQALDGVREMGLDPEEVLLVAEAPLYATEQAVRSQPTNLAQHIAKAMLLAAPEAHLAILGGGSIRLDDDQTGPYTAYDVVRTLPFGGHLVELEVNGETLMKILHAGDANTGTGGYLQYASPSTEVGGTRPVVMRPQKIGLSWFLDGQRIEAANIYRIVVNDYLVTGKERGLGFLNATSPEILSTFPHYAEDDPKADIRKAFIAYLRQLK